MNRRPPLFFLFFFSIFGFIGLSLIIWLWTAEGFGAPPTIFKIFGSFIALAFMALGFGMPASVLMNKDKLMSPADPVSNPNPRKKKAPGTYDCPNCGANVGKVEVSPSGDLKCSYCNEWWNIHRQ